MNGLKVSWRCDQLPTTPALSRSVITEDGAWYEVIYRYEQRGVEFWAVLDHVTEQMPPTPPQLKRYDDRVRLPMMRADGTPDLQAEVEQRRKEWADVNREAWAARNG